MSFTKIEEIEARNKEIALLIERAERSGDASRFELKKELYQNKIEIINLITIDEQRAGITASQLIDLVEAMPHQTKYSIGISAIDRQLASWEDKQMGIVGGFETGTFVNLAGESGAGKTTLTIDILANVSRYSKTVFFNHEMGLRRIASRLKRRLTEKVQRDNMIIDSSTDKIDDLVMEITLYARDGIKFFVIDSRMKIKAQGDSDVQKNADISNKLSKVAREKDIIVILINQMSESDIKEKRLALKGGGDAKYDSDMVLFYIKDDKDITKRKLVCTKNRTGDENLWSVELTVRDGKTCGINEFSRAEVVYETPKIEAGFVL
jgi:predicted ATP-dependent serine protease